ncbi:MAG: winged helix-turn-helix transcriptional regulator [Bacteroidia bacterium]|jgi:ATP-dependent DNA helicase RecG|nr:winged helix-turn-helix transcriptional regulator [Bacteroidia bacterium]
MISIDEINAIIASGEGYNAEFILSIPSKVKDLSEEVCAFANAAGGVLLIAINHAEFGKKSHSRNPLIFGLFARMHLVEKIGSGIIRIKDLMQEAGLPEPAYSFEGMFTVGLQRPIKTSAKTVEETSKNSSNTLIEKGLATVEETVEEMIMNLIIENPRFTANEMVKVTGLSRRGVEYQLGKLKQSGKIMRIGSTKAGNWIVRKPKGK